MGSYQRPLAEGGELLLQRLVDEKAAGRDVIFDAIVIGSGYGGSVTAARLADTFRGGRADKEKLSVCVLERGNEHLPGAFPAAFSTLPGHVRINRYDTPELTGDALGLFDVRIGEDVSVLLGNGLGGGSLINAGVGERPDPAVFRSGWPERLRDETALEPYFREAAAVLGLDVAPVQRLRKYREFESWAEGLGAEVRPARVAVTFADTKDNGSGVAQQACIQCGDCVTGCNHHAKNTLPMNYLARARRAGAKLYTGVTVLHLKRASGSVAERPEEALWEVWFRLTPRSGAPSSHRNPNRLLARQVVLAAGALGSTEILMRSRAKGLSLSPMLGASFSTNGDMISGLHEQDCRVNAAAAEDVAPEARGIGPTITGIARAKFDESPPLVLEELAIPAALRRIFEEVVTTAGLPYRLARFDSSWNLLGQRADPLAVDPRSVDRTQVFAAMGVDAAQGRLEMVDGWDADNHKIADGALVVKWPDAGTDPVFSRQDAFMARSTSNGGDYVRSPLWNPLPPQITAQLSGNKPKGKLFTVHPLGGCRMADDARFGVVNDIGQVFSGSEGAAVHPGLMVLDGAIIPTAIGINPLLTITALAERAVEACIDREVAAGRWQRAPARTNAAPAEPIPERAPALHRGMRRAGRAAGVYALADVLSRHPAAGAGAHAPSSTRLRFAERLHGTLPLREGAGTNVELTLRFQEVDQLPAYLRNAERRLSIESGELRGSKPEDAPAPCAAVEGHVVLLEPCRVAPSERVFVSLLSFLRTRGVADWLLLRRQARAGKSDKATRGDIFLGKLLCRAAPAIAVLCALFAEAACLLWPLWRVLRRIFPLLRPPFAWTWRARRFVDRRVPAVRAWIEAAKTKLGVVYFVPFAYQTGEVRRLRYDLALAGDLVLDGCRLPKGTRITGTKILRYAEGSNPWKQLFRLPVVVTPPGGARAYTTTLDVDLDYFFRRYAAQLQITRQKNLPDSLLDIASLTAFLGRMIGKVHFWSFRLPEYQRHDPNLRQKRTPGKLGGLNWRNDLRVETVDEKTGRVLHLPVTRYWKGEQPSGMPIVLFHGLGASGNQFATPRLDKNLVQHLAEDGRDVWVAEMRHSIATPSCEEQWTLDEIALGDVPKIIAKVRDVTGAAKVDVVAHCIGSAMFCIAALAGKLEGADGSWINAAVLMQVGPLITLSPGTRIRAYLAAFLRRYTREIMVDFSIDDSADWMDAFIDRLLATYPYPASEERHHRLDPPWQPHTHIANCNRWSAIDGRMIEHRNLSPKMLEGLGEILGPANLTTWEQTIQFAYMRRLTDAESRNSYVTFANVRRHLGFPVRFIHGQKNDVFAVETSKSSCRLLLDVHGPDHPCDVQVIPGYSHLDPLIGRHAHRDVYPLISRWLDQETRVKEGEAPAQLPEVRLPLIGPIVGWTRREEGQWVTRVWCRVDDTEAPCSRVVAIPLKGGVPIKELIQARKPRKGKVDTLTAFDVRLGSDNADCDILVVSVHQSKLEREGKEESADMLGQTLDELRDDEKDEYIDKGLRLIGRRAIGTMVAALDGRAARCTTDDGYDRPLDRGVLRKDLLEALAGSETIRFAFGSCRYGASVVDRERADALFGRLRNLMEEKEASPSLLLLVGDQIYADQTAGVFDPRGRRERFYEAYREAWTAPNARVVFGQLPTYMMMDDHEVGDNWHPLDNCGPAEQLLRTQGVEAFEEYQLLQSPRPLAARALRAAPPEGFGYEFAAAGFGFFVFDTRTGRDRLGRIVRAEQMERFRGWLARQPKDQPKFVVSPSVIVPFLCDSGPERGYAYRSDGWDGYPESLRELFIEIWKQGRDNVIFLCGDAHFSMASEIRFTDDRGRTLPGPRAYCIVSSGLYAPFPFANGCPADYLAANEGERRVEIEKAAVWMQYRTLSESLMLHESFSIVEAAKAGDGWRIGLRQYFAEDGLNTIELVSGSPVKPVQRTEASEEHGRNTVVASR